MIGHRKGGPAAAAERVHSMAVISFLVSRFAALGLPEPLRKAAAWVTLILAALALLAAGKALYDRSIIEDHEKDRAVESIEARDKASEERATDTIANIEAARAREEAIRGAQNDGAAIPPSTRALNCKRLEQAYSVDELAKMHGYRDLCR
jgi:hypothetical protein